MRFSRLLWRPQANGTVLSTRTVSGRILRRTADSMNLQEVRGVDLDPQTRCKHYRGPTDIIAIKMKCCGIYYACRDCHVLADHQIEVWPESEWDREAILCGVCGTELTIGQYMQGKSRCPACHERFNPRCRNHHLYFQVRRSAGPRIEES